MLKNFSLARIAALAIGFISFALCGGCVLSVPLAAWIWPAALLYVSRSCSRAREFAWVALVVAVGIVIRYLGFFGDDAILPTAALAAVVSLTWLVPLFIDCQLHLKRSDAWWTFLPFPVMMVAIELAEGNLVGFGTAIFIANTQSSVLFMVQICSVIGCGGLSFVIYLFGSLLERGIGLGIRKASGRACTVVAVAILVVVAGFGVWHLSDNSGVREVGQLRIASISPGKAWVEDTSDDLVYREGIFEEDVARLKSDVEKVEEQTPDIICWSETAFGVRDTGQEMQLTELAKELSESTQAMLIVPYQLYDTGDGSGMLANKAIIVLPDGQVTSYTKQHLVPFVEAPYYEAGDEPYPQVTFKGIRISMAICFDDQFPDCISAISSSTDLFLAPTIDWHAVWGTHARSSLMRPIENGITYARVNVDGYSYAADCDGNLFYSYSNKDYEDGLLVVEDVPVRTADTLYPVIDPILLAAFSLAALASLVILIGGIFSIGRFGSAGKPASKQNQ